MHYAFEVACPTLYMVTDLPYQGKGSLGPPAGAASPQSNRISGLMMRMRSQEGLPPTKDFASQLEVSSTSH